MAALPQISWENFAIEWVERKLLGDKHAVANAYAKAFARDGIAPKSAASNGQRLYQKKEIKQRCWDLYAAACEYRGIRVVDLVTRIDRVGRANVVEFYDWNPETKRLELKNIKDLPRELTAAISKIKYTEDGRVELELADANQANFTLLKHFGGLPEPDGPRTQVNIFNALSVEDQAALANLIDALPGGTSDSGGTAAPEREPGGTLPAPV